MSAIDYREIALSLEKRKRSRGRSAGVANVVTFEDRIAAGVAAELSGDRANMVGVVGLAPAPRRSRAVPPERWNLVHVMDRLEEAWLTLGRLPVVTRPRGYANAMPAYVYSRFDLNAQLETLELERTLKIKNRVRLPATSAEVSRMDEAFGWPIRYLSETEQHHLARAVNLCTRWAAYNVPRDGIENECERLAVNVTVHQLYRRKMLGLQIICRGLLVDRALVR